MSSGSEPGTAKQPPTTITPIIAALLVFVAPIFVVTLARQIFRNIIEVQRIDLAFLPGANFGEPYVVPFIPAKVVSSLYNFGFALCGVMVFAISLIAYSSVIVWHATKEGFPRFTKVGLRVGYFVGLLALFILMVVDFEHWRITNYLPTAITRAMINGTLDQLPTCDASPSLGKCHGDGIGNTGNSLERIVATAMGVVSVAGLSLITAIAILTGSSSDMNDRIARIKSITLLAAMTFLLTIVAVHLLFQPGADMLAGAYGGKAEDNLQMQNYANLRSAMTLYWATIFSLALGTAHFLAVTLIQGQAEGFVDFGGVWNVFKALLTVLSPVIADWALKFGESFGGAIAAP